MSVNYNHVFMVFIFFIGLILTIFSSRIDKNATANNCNSEELRLLTKVLLCMGITFTVSALSFFMCVSNCGKSETVFSLYIYMIFTFLLGVGIIVISSLIMSSSSDCKSIGSDINVILGVGILITVISLGYFILSIKNKASARRF